MTTKFELKKKFAEKFPTFRLLAIQLNGFSHKVFYDLGSHYSPVSVLEWSAYTDGKGALQELFDGFPHLSYQGNPIEYVYVRPEKR
jgi:hypothetical protein